MKRFFLVRNAEHACADSDSWPSADTELSDIGRYQAIDIGRELEKRHISVIYSSTCKRATQTAAPLRRRLGLDIKQSRNFDGVLIGNYAGLAQDEIRGKLQSDYDEIFKAPRPDKDYFKTGETLNIIADRAWKQLNDIVSIANDNTLAIFTHKEIIGVLLCKIVSMPLSNFWWWAGREQSTPYGGITELTYADNMWSLVRFGCTAHLKNT